LNGLYATLFIGLFYFFFASYFCPHGALLPEITSDSGERVSISILTAIFGMLSAAIIGIGSGVLVDRFGFRVTGLVLGLLAAPFLCAPVAVIREKPRGEADEITFSFREAVIQTIHNRPFMIFAISSVFALLAQNTIVGALPYFVAVVLGGSESQMGFLMGGSLAVALASFPLMTRLAAKWGKGRVLEVSMLAGAVILASLFLVGRLDLPIPPLHQTIILIGLSGLSFAPLMVLPTAILADAIDYEYETSGKRRSAMYLGFQGILQKATMAFAPLVVSTLFTVFGYSAERPLGVRLVGPVTALLLLGAWWVFRGYPLKDR
jgi:GPH family glycoside/pentoside/hexuronide:cation symporter